MKFHVKRIDLRPLIASAVNIAGPNGNIHVIAAETLSVEASRPGAVVSYRGTAPAEIAATGAVTIPATCLGTIVSGCPAAVETIEFETVGTRLHVRFGTDLHQLVMVDEARPVFGTVSGTAVPEELGRAIGMAWGCGDTAPTHRHVYLQANGDVVAISPSSVVCSSVPDAVPDAVAIPSELVGFLARVIAADSTIAIEPRFVEIRSATETVRVLRGTETLPAQYRLVVDAAGTEIPGVPPAGLADALKRLGETTQITMGFGPSGIELSHGVGQLEIKDFVPGEFPALSCKLGTTAPVRKFLEGTSDDVVAVVSRRFVVFRDGARRCAVQRVP
jgi:hypothetical protein